MTVAVSGATVQLSGRCGAEEAEALLVALSDGATEVDLTGCEHLHAALLQLLMAFEVSVTGTPSPFLADWVCPATFARDTFRAAHAED